MKRERRERAAVVQASEFIPQLMAGFGMLRRGVFRSDDVVLGELTRESGGGFTGMGCVGKLTSPGTSLLATGVSTTPKTGLPVTRSRMYM